MQIPYLTNTRCDRCGQGGRGGWVGRGGQVGWGGWGTHESLHGMKLKEAKNIFKKLLL